MVVVAVHSCKVFCGLCIDIIFKRVVVFETSLFQQRFECFCRNI